MYVCIYMLQCSFCAHLRHLRCFFRPCLLVSKQARKKNVKKHALTCDTGDSKVSS